MAGIAGNVLLYLDFLAGTGRYVCVIHLQLYEKIGTARANTTARTATSPTKEGAEHIVAEYIAEILEDVFHAHAATTVTTTGRTAHTCMTEAIIAGFLISIAEDV